MAFSYGFFDAQNRDRVYTAENFTAYLSSLICNGILDTYGDCFAVTANNNLTVTVGTGKAWIGGHYFNNDAPHSEDLSSHVDTSANRYVTIGICCDTANRECSLVVRSGATAPKLTSSGQQSYLTIAAVYLPAGTSSVITADITDYRGDESKCGYVKCILGKCGISDLIGRLDELESRAAALERIIGFNSTDLPVIAFSHAATGLTGPVSDMKKPIDGLIGIVGSLDGLKIAKEEQ